MKKQKNIDKENLELQNSDNLFDEEADINDGFGDFSLYDDLDSYQYFDEMSSDGEDDDKRKTEQSGNMLLALAEDNVVAMQGDEQAELVVDENKPIKVKEIAVQNDNTKVNAFDLFFLRLWAGMVSLLGYMANGVNFCINAIFKRKLPVRYIKAFLVVLIIILLLLIIIVPISANNNSGSSSGDGLVIFESNLIPVKVRVDDGSGEPIYKWGYLNRKNAQTSVGKDSLAIAAKYEEALPFNKFGIAWGRVKDKNGHYWELINTKGKRVGERTYPVSSTVPISERPFGEFSNNKLAWVNENGKYGYIDTKGNVKIACDLDVAGNFIDGIARVGRGNYEWYINSKGAVVGRGYNYIQVLDFSCGLGAVNKGGRWGFVNKKGKEVIELKYDAVSQFVDGYAMVKMGKTFGLINTKGELVINTQWYYDIIIKNDIFEKFLADNKD